MKFTEKTIQLFGSVVLALFITACSQAPKPGTPEAAAAGVRLMRTMSDTLARAKALTFETSERFDVSPTGGENKVLHFTRKVTVRRPNGLFFEVHGQGDTATAKLWAQRDRGFNQPGAAGNRGVGGSARQTHVVGDPRV